MGSPTTSERARRMVALLGRFRSESSEPLAALADELGVSPDELATDIATLSVCGVAPYYPDQMVDVFVEEGTVTVYTPVPAVPSPVRLSSVEARALVAALQVAGFRDDDELVDRLLDATTVDVDPAELRRRIAPSVAQHDGSVFATLAEATDRRRVVVIEHRSSRDPGATTERSIEPLALFGERGAWYVQSFCREAGAIRTFRLDRIESARMLEEEFPPRTDIVPQMSAFEHEGLPYATVEFESDERFDEREWPGVSNIRRAGGRVVAEVPYAGTSWIARQVVARVGGVRVTAPREVRDAVISLVEEIRAAHAESSDSG